MELVLSLKPHSEDQTTGKPFWQSLLKKKNGIDSIESKECPICLGKLRIGNVTKPKCGHRYHKICLDKWSAQGSGICPFCRAELGSPDNFQPDWSTDFDALVALSDQLKARTQAIKSKFTETGPGVDPVTGCANHDFFLYRYCRLRPSRTLGLEPSQGITRRETFDWDETMSDALDEEEARASFLRAELMVHKAPTPTYPIGWDWHNPKTSADFHWQPDFTFLLKGPMGAGCIATRRSSTSIIEGDIYGGTIVVNHGTLTIVGNVYKATIWARKADLIIKGRCSGTKIRTQGSTVEIYGDLENARLSLELGKRKTIISGHVKASYIRTVDTIMQYDGIVENTGMHIYGGKSNLFASIEHVRVDLFNGAKFAVRKQKEGCTISDHGNPQQAPLSAKIPSDPRLAAFLSKY